MAYKYLDLWDDVEDAKSESDSTGPVEYDS
jgi:hypothetical protein